LKGSISRWRDTRGSTMATTTQDQIRGPVAFTMIMRILVITGMETMDTINAMVMDITTMEGMVTSIMAARVKTITTPEKVTVTTIEATMEGTIRTLSKRILVRWSVLSATRMDNMLMIVLRERMMKATRQIR
jgi:hypothetical protein